MTSKCDPIFVFVFLPQPALLGLFSVIPKGRGSVMIDDFVVLCLLPLLLYWVIVCFMQGLLQDPKAAIDLDPSFRLTPQAFQEQWISLPEG